MGAAESSLLVITLFPSLPLSLFKPCVYGFGPWASAQRYFISSGSRYGRKRRNTLFAVETALCLVMARCIKCHQRGSASSPCLWESCREAERLSIKGSGFDPGQTKGEQAHLWADVPQPPAAKTFCDRFHTYFTASHRLEHICVAPVAQDDVFLMKNHFLKYVVPYFPRVANTALFVNYGAYSGWQMN